ncbi:MAG: hypothetical protein K8R59_06075 [Thermoanaerobaculales bacterium]|nr:hypothetical protein [Thermoanaerobaculales bacterium]
MNIDALAPEAIPGIRIMPILHERVDFASLVRCVLEELQPAAVAVELPTTVAEAARTAVRRLPEMSVVFSEDENEPALIWVASPGDPLVEALRWADETGRSSFFVDPDIDYPHRHQESLPDPWVLWSVGAEAYLETVRTVAGGGAVTDEDRLRERGMAYHLHQARLSCHGALLALVGAAHAERVARLLNGPTAPPFARQHRKRVGIRNLHPDSLSAVLPDAPLIHAAYEYLRAGRAPEEDAELEDAVSQRLELEYGRLRLIHGGGGESRRERAHNLALYAAKHAYRGGPGGRPVPDRQALGHVVWRVATRSWREQTREKAAAWQRRLFFDFARRHARVQGQIVPGLYEWVTAARGVGDDNLAWETFDAAVAYPWQSEKADLPTARVDGEMLDLGSRRIRFRRRFFRTKRRLVSIPVRRRAPEDPSEWLNAFDGQGICSHPPEDIVIEDYGRFLQHKAVSILASETARSEPFSTSMLDGIDLRETLMRWHEGRIWVQEKGRAPGAAGSVVVIFEEDHEDTSYPYLMTWLGEHEQESDMALYATDPAGQIVGPGIMRATYGGFMLTYPPGRLSDVWHDPDYREARSKAETLLMAAVDYSIDKIVVYTAPQPPASRISDWAAHQGKRIVFIPLGSLSPVTLKKVRVLHILAGYDKREIARDYIW